MEHYRSTITMLVPQREQIVKSYLSGSESESYEESDLDESLGAIKPTTTHKFSEMPQDFFSILKAAKFLRLGYQNTVTAALGSISDADLLNPINLTALSDLETMEKIVNIAESNDIQCRISALTILRILTQVEKIAVVVVNLGIIPVCVNLLRENSLDILEHAASIICNVGHLRRAEKACRRTGVISILVSLLHVKKSILLAPTESLTQEERDIISLTRCVAEALWKLSTFTKNKTIMLKSGIFPLISDILVSGNNALGIPVSGILAECSTEFLFQMAIETEGIIGVILDCLTRGDRGLEWSSASTIMKAAGENAIVRDMIRFHGGLRIIVQLVKLSDQSDKKLMAAAIGALWKSAISEKNVVEYEELGVIDLLVPFVTDDDIDVQISAVGGLAEMAKNESCRKRIVVANVIPKIVEMLSLITPRLLATAAQFVEQVALFPEGMKIIEENEGVRLIWSLLRTSKDRDVIIKALWAIKSTVTRASDPGEHIRQLTGSLELLVNMLKNKDIGLLTAVCAVIGEVALDYENLGVMTEQGVVRHLSKIVLLQGDDDLRRELCSAISNCCFFRPNLVAFSRMRIIPLLCTFLSTKDQDLLAQACRCFYTLSRRPMNCVEMHGCGVVPFLLCATESSNRVTQISAAGCLANIRRVLLEADYRKTHDTCMKTPSSSTSSEFGSEYP